MVELALTLTFLLILLAGTMDLGRAFFTWIEMRDAAQEGAVYGSICPVSANIITRAKANLNPPDDFTVTPFIPNLTIGQPIKVTIETDFPITTPFLSTVLQTDTIVIHATIIDSIINPSCP
jgi:Flp pilus assembly protein TadG